MNRPADARSQAMRVGELAARAGVSRRALRYYEEQGLLDSTRSTGGHRLYAPDAADRVAYLKHLYAAGLSSQGIRNVISCLESPTPETSDGAFAHLVREREQLLARIETLRQSVTALDELIALNRANRPRTSAQVSRVTSA